MFTEMMICTAIAAFWAARHYARRVDKLEAENFQLRFRLLKYERPAERPRFEKVIDIADYHKI